MIAITSPAQAQQTTIKQLQISQRSIAAERSQLAEPVPPKAPFRLPKEGSGLNDPLVKKYAEEIKVYLNQKEIYSEAMRKQKPRWFELPQNRLESLASPTSYVPDKLLKWNSNIFWAPASISKEVNLRYADEVRSVLGKIPDFDVTTLGKRTLPDGSTIETGLLLAEVDGNQVELLPNPNKPQLPLEFRHRDPKGNIIKWTSTIDQCDKPSLAGGVTPCGTASRLSRISKGNVEWIALARKTKGVEKLTTESFWSADDPSYSLVGYIGFNRVTGEVAFFDGTYDDSRKFDWKTTLIAPGGNGYLDEKGRALAVNTYDSTFRINCATCHDNKEPRIITPYIKQARVGYRNSDTASAFSLGELLPDLPRMDTKPYRVIGSDYNSIHAEDIREARTVRDPNGSCTVCHTLTNKGTARFASDSVARLGTLAGDDDTTENLYRTVWALRTGAGSIHPWMNPGDGNDLSASPLPPPLSDAGWTALKGALENPDLNPNSTKVYTEAPAPGEVANDKTKLADTSLPTALSIVTSNNRDSDNPTFPNEVQVSWLYLNSLGGIPDRDDVRFNLAIRETDIPADAQEPELSEFPSLEQAKGIGATEIGGPVLFNDGLVIFKDISYVGHLAGTDAIPSTTPRQYSVSFPAASKKRYLVRVLPKRFSFDSTPEKFSNNDFVLYIDS